MVSGEAGFSIPSGSASSRWVAAALACLLALCLLAPRAEAAWREPVSISASLEGRGPQVAFDEEGNATVAWVAGTTSRDINVSEHPAGGTWSNPTNRITGAVAADECTDPQLAVNSAGAAALIADCGTGATEMRYATRTIFGTWAPPTAVPETGEGSEPRIGIDDGGDVVLVWQGAGSTVKAKYRPAGGAWSSAKTLSTAGKSGLEPNVAMSHDGYSYAIWREERKTTGLDQVIEVRVARKEKGAAGAWAASDVLTNNFSNTPITEGEPQIAVNASGQKLAAWLVADPGEKVFLQSCTSNSALSGWNEPLRSSSDTTAHVKEPQIALADGGNSFSTWHSFPTSTEAIKVAVTSSLTGTWSSPTTIGEPAQLNGVGSVPTAAGDPAGDAMVAWGAGLNVWAVPHLAGGSFPAPVKISTAALPNFEFPTAAMDSRGNAIVAWATNTSPTHIAVAVNDVTPPVITVTPTIPVAFSEAVHYNATATDAWSSPVTLSWDFGDGATATGGSVSHAYATSGTVTATVTATDAAGNSSTAVAETWVGGPAATPDPPVIPARTAVKVIAKPLSQPWAKIAKAKAVKLRCKLDVSGSCSATASVSAGVAKLIGLKGRPGKAVTIGHGSTPARGGKFTIVKVKLKNPALADIGAATRPVPVSFAVKGTSAGHDDGGASTKLKIVRP